MYKTAKATLIILALAAALGSAIGLIALVNRSANSGKSKTIVDEAPTTSSISSSSRESASQNSSSSREANPYIQEGPYLIGDKTEIAMSMSLSEGVYPESSFKVYLSQVPEGYGRNSLYIASCDSSFRDYLYFYVIRDGREVSCGNGASVYDSGEVVHIRQRKAAPISGGYSVILNIGSPYSDLNVSVWNIEVRMKTTP